MAANSTSTTTTLSLPHQLTNITTTVTQTFTGFHTTTQQVPASGFVLGVPDDLWFLIIIGAVVLGVYFFRTQVKDIPVNILWVFKNHSGRIFRAAEDLEGAFLTVFDWKGKGVETLKKNGVPVEVTYLPEKAKAYIVRSETKNGKPMDDATKRALEAQGFKVEEQPDGKKGEKAYVINRDPKEERTTAYLDVHLGGLKSMRLYTTLQGTGTTIDLLKELEKATATTKAGNESVMHEERGAAKAYLRDIAEAFAGSWKTVILPLVAGLGIGGMISLLLILLTGHFK